MVAGKKIQLSLSGFEPLASRFMVEPQRDDLTTNRQGLDTMMSV